MLPTMELTDFLELYLVDPDGKLKNNKLVNIRGCNGAGKSTVPISMLESDDDAFEVMWITGCKLRTMATVFPKYNYVALGHYHSKCGGMDSIKTTDEIKAITNILWNTDLNILMEGVLASTVRQTYIDLFTNLNLSNKQQREINIYNILPPLDVCLKRIQQRNGGKEIKEDLVANKWNTVEKNCEHFKNAGFKVYKVSNDGINKEDTLDWFFNYLKSDPI